MVMVSEAAHQHELDVPLLVTNPDRTGTVWTAFSHIITGVIGAGVLSIAWSIAQLGWIAGPLALIFFATIIVFSTFLLCDCYISYDSENVETSRNNSLMLAVRNYLGDKQGNICGVLVHESMFGNGIAYTITAAVSMRAIQQSNCYHKEGHDATCSYSDSQYMLFFGLIQVIMSQIPDFHNMAWLSVLAAIMSFSYASIGFGLGVLKVVADGTIKGSITGISASSTLEKVSLVFQALGDIAFAYPYSIIVLEIQDTLKSPPSESQSMKKASLAAVITTTCFYLCCGCFGYAAFGDDTPGNILTGFGYYEPYWLIDFANACIVVHLVGGYQIYSQPVFTFVEGWFSDRFPYSNFVNRVHALKIPFLPVVELNFLRLCFRTAYVISTTGLALLFPYFNEVLGVLGALNFWPLAIYFPVEIYLSRRKMKGWSQDGIFLRGFSLCLLAVSIVSLMGSIEGLLSAELS